MCYCCSSLIAHVGRLLCVCVVCFKRVCVCVCVCVCQSQKSKSKLFNGLGFCAHFHGCVYNSNRIFENEPRYVHKHAIQRDMEATSLLFTVYE